jgi:hypothetical protein
MIIVSLSCLHICSGPNHYLPFIALAKSRNWKFSQTIFYTIICSIGHIAGAVIISFLVIALGWSVSKIKWFENFRGNTLGWILLLLGILYTIWGIKKAKQNNPHKHFEADEKGNLFVYEHKHNSAVTPQQKHAVTPWVMFIIFTLAPNEPMIPLLSLFGINNNFWGVVLFISIYIISTILTTLILVIAGYYSLSLFKTSNLERYMPAVCGLAICFCGISMLWLGW